MNMLDKSVSKMELEVKGRSSSRARAPAPHRSGRVGRRRHRIKATFRNERGLFVLLICFLILLELAKRRQSTGEDLGTMYAQVPKRTACFTSLDFSKF
ncbi:MAG: hypothetical protein DMG93_00660 [Acidobacteria bacterium]|nr:MAG: hypothetical protein DMG93_00660 [Acidobacteriota bacterium]